MTRPLGSRKQIGRPQVAVEDAFAVQEGQAFQGVLEPGDDLVQRQALAGVQFLLQGPALGQVHYHEAEVRGELDFQGRG